MFNLRYHIASLAAVFLALAVGLLLGGVVVERGTLDRQRDSIVKSLQEDFARLSAENRELGAANDRGRRFGEELLPGIVGGQLTARPVLVVTDPSRRDVTRAATDALRAAGALPVALRLKVKDFGIADERYASFMPPLPEGDDQARLDALSSTLAAEWAGAGPRPVTEKLREGGVIDGDDLPLGMLGGVVVAASWDGEDGAAAKADPACIAIAERVARAGLPVVAAETTDADSGCVSAAVARGLSAVDDVDEPEGVMSLVWVLSGKAEGYFGIRSQADAPFPRLGEG